MHPYLELSKARLTSLVLLTTAVGFLVSGHHGAPGLRFLWTVLGTGLAAAGANTLNQWIEVQLDARMERTRLRPLPTGRISPARALALGLASAAAGVTILFFLVNPLTAALGAFVVLLYTLAYTPMKQRTPLCTLIGAVCGAIPPMMGWSGASGSLAYGAWILGATLFLWQIPHFLALAWLYRADYARGGFKMLPSVDPTGRMTGLLAVVYITALLPLGLFALFAGISGWAFAAGAFVLGCGFLFLGLRLHREHSDRSARRLFLGSLLYLPFLLGLMVLDRGPARTLEAASLLPAPAVSSPAAARAPAAPLVSEIEPPATAPLKAAADTRPAAPAFSDGPALPR